MPALAVNDLVEMKIFGSIFNQRTITTFAYRVSTASTGTNMNTLLQGCADYFDNGAVAPGLAFYDCCAQNWESDYITAQTLYPVAYRAALSITGLPGTDPFDAVTANSAASIERATSLAGRGEQGRISIPAISPDRMADGLLTAPFIVKMQTLCEKMLNVWSNPLIDATLALTPVLVHRWKVGDPPRWAVRDYTDLLVAKPKLEVRTQRTRNIGKGI